MTNSLCHFSLFSLSWKF